MTKADMDEWDVVRIVYSGKPLCIAKDGTHAKCIAINKPHVDQSTISIDINLANTVVARFENFFELSPKEDFHGKEGWESRGLPGEIYDVWRLRQ